MKKDRPSATAALVASLRAIYTAMPEPYRLAPDPLARELVPFRWRSRPRRSPARPGPLPPFTMPSASRRAASATTSRCAPAPSTTPSARPCASAPSSSSSSAPASTTARSASTSSASVRAFEIDYPSTQRYKAARLAALRSPPLPKARSLARVPVDFEQDRLDQSLLTAGFDPAARTFWIWEGVVVYLTREAISSTLAAVSAPLRQGEPDRAHLHAQAHEGVSPSPSPGARSTSLRAPF